MKPELFISLDIETDGPTPGINSMLSLGCSALLADGTEVDYFYQTMQPLPGAKPDPATALWWDENPEAYTEATTNQNDPQDVTLDFIIWLKALIQNYQVTLVAAPSGFDFTYLYYYMMLYADESPLRHNCIDMRSFVMGMTGKPFQNTGKRHWPKNLRSKQPHTHNALDDAREQGETFINMLLEARK